jgi:uncharacterized coiled-coil protein SlyX
MTYRDVALALKISEPSIKRMFASGRFTIDRLVQISNLLGFTLAELSKEAQAAQPSLRTLTEKQERELVSETKLLVVAVCALNHWTLDEIISYYRLTKAECIKYLLRLDSLQLINLLPGNRIRISVARDFDWLPFGPIQQYFRNKGQSDFLAGQFSQIEDANVFTHGMFTDQALAQMQSELQRLRQRFAELHEQSLTAPLSKRRGFGLLYAMRQWEPLEFVQLRR